MRFSRKLLLGMLLSAALSSAAYADGQITLIHTGDFHGHLTPRPNLRSNADYPGQTVGGLARIKTIIDRIQANQGGRDKTLVMHTGDTIQGSGEALYTRGQAIVDVVDMLGIDAYAPGNWDFVYGPERFIELFASNLMLHVPSIPEAARAVAAIPPPAATRWGGLVSNVYLTNSNAPKRPTATDTVQGANLSQAEYDAYAQWYLEKGQRVLPPYTVKTVNGVKVGILGCTTSRGPQVVGSWVTDGLEFTDCSNEVKKFTRILRTVERAEVVVLISEIEIGRNIQMIRDLEADQHIDVVLNADMHEEAVQPIRVRDKSGAETLIIEEGQDGTMISAITLTVSGGQVVSGPVHNAYSVDDRTPEDPSVAAKVAQVRYPFNEGFNSSIACSESSPYVNPFTKQTCLKGPLSAEVGRTDVALHRSNFSDEAMPAVIEGSSHDFIADAIRWWAKSDLATVRGFRYGTHVAPGPITRNDLYHFVPIGPRVGKAARVSANQLRNQIDNSSLAVFSSDPGNVVTPRPAYNNNTYANFTSNDAGSGTTALSPGAGLPVGGLGGNALGWGGGWLFAYSGEGFRMDFDPYFIPNWQTLRSGSATATSPSGIYLENNTLKATPPSDESRARSLTVKMPCKYLPPAQIASTGCNLADTETRYPTTITNATNGRYESAWTASYTADQIKANNPGTTNNAYNSCVPLQNPQPAGTTACGYTPYLLNPDGWVYLNGTPNQPKTNFTVNQHFKAGLFAVAGYFYAQSPNTINNCNNCYATGTVDGNIMGNMSIADPDPLAPAGNRLLNPNVAFLLPVNELNGEPALDSYKNPRLVQDPTKADGIARDEKNRPISAGNPIDLTEIIEKYLAHIGPVTTEGPNANLRLNRIGLAKPLPASSAGLRVMQPLCGTLGKGDASGAVCP